MASYRSRRDGSHYPLHHSVHVEVPTHESHDKEGAVEHVEGYSYTREEPGVHRTPEEDRWYEANGTLDGWHKGQSEEERHREILKTAEREGYAKTYHKLIGLANVTTDRGTEEKARADYRWLDRTHGEEIHRGLAAERPG